MTRPKKLQAANALGLEKKNLNDAKIAAKKTLAASILKLAPTYLIENFGAIEQELKKNIDLIDKATTSEQVKEIALNAKFDSLQPSQGSVPEVFQLYAQYKKTTKEAKNFCETAPDNYKKNERAILSQYAQVNAVIVEQEKNIDKYFVNLARQHFTKLASGQKSDLHSQTVELLTKGELSKRATVCQKAYQEKICNNPICTKTIKDNKLVQLGTIILNGFVLFTGLSLAVSVGAKIYNRNKENAPTVSLVQSLTSDHKKRAKKDADTFFNFFKVPKVAEENHNKENNAPKKQSPLSNNKF